MKHYASGTCVGEDRSRAELQFLLEKFGADQFGYVSDRSTSTAKIMFRYRCASFVFRLPLARPDDKAVRFTPNGRLRVSGQVDKLIRDENRRRWRSLCLAIKAMLVGVQDGIFNFAEIFMPYMVWGDGRTTAETLLPVAESCLKGGAALPALADSTRLLDITKEEATR